MKELNLIPYSLKEKKQKLNELRLYAAVGILILGILSAGIYLPRMMLVQFKTEEKILLNKTNENKEIIEESKAVKSEIEGYNERTQLIDFFSKNKTLVSGKIVDIEKYIPKDVALSTLNYTEEGIEMTGSTSNYNSAAEFAANLETSKNYKSVKIIRIDGDGQHTPYNFTIKIVR